MNLEILNKWEIEYNIQFDPKSLKDYMSKALADSKSWPMKKETDLSKVRLKFGSDFNPDLPNIIIPHQKPILLTQNQQPRQCPDHQPFIKIYHTVKVEFLHFLLLFEGEDSLKQHRLHLEAYQLYLLMFLSETNCCS